MEGHYNCHQASTESPCPGQDSRPVKAGCSKGFVIVGGPGSMVPGWLATGEGASVVNLLRWTRERLRLWSICSESLFRPSWGKEGGQASA